MKFPEDSIQDFVGAWWIKDDSRTIERGRLIQGYVPYIDLKPYTLVAKRVDSEDHKTAKIELTGFDVSKARFLERLPVAALPLNSGEMHLVYKGKRRPLLVLFTGADEIPKALRTGGGRKITAKTMLVAPYCGAKPDGSRGGFQEELVTRIRRCEYPHLMWDRFPGASTDSILKLDHIQPLGMDKSSCEVSEFRLSDDAIDIIDERLDWLFKGKLTPEGVLEFFRSELACAAND